MKTGCIIQARTTSSRLPGKVLKTLDYETGATILDEVILRIKKVEAIDVIIVATTTNKADDAIIELAEKRGVAVYRGSENDVLDRYYQAATLYELDTVIRITSDCPFIDPYVLNDLIDLYKSGKYDYASNTIIRTYPHGLDCEIFSYEALKKVKELAKEQFYKEHVTSYIYTNSDQFSIGSIKLEKDYHHFRITVDTEQDYILACAIKDCLGKEQYDYQSVLSTIERRPYLQLINKDIKQKRQFTDREDELKVAIELLNLQELTNAADVIKNYLKKEETCH